MKTNQINLLSGERRLVSVSSARILSMPNLSALDEDGGGGWVVAVLGDGEGGRCSSSRVVIAGLVTSACRWCPGRNILIRAGRANERDCQCETVADFSAAANGPGAASEAESWSRNISRQRAWPVEISSRWCPIINGPH